MSFFYRFRATDSLLGQRNELQKQEIYFAQPQQLNDPMEGFTDVYWQGDRIVWTNLIRHYLLCLELAVQAASVIDDDYKPDMFPVSIFASEIALPTPEAKDTYRKICRSFFSNSEVATVPDLLAEHTHPIRREELTFYIQGLHGWALACVIEVLQEEHRIHRIPPSTNQGPIAKVQPVTNMLRILKQREKIAKSPERVLFGLAGQLSRRTLFLNYLNAGSAAERMWQMIVLGFPEVYAKELNRLVYSDWYTACFVGEHNHAAMWGNYGDGHKGVCMKFRAIDGADGIPSLKLRQVIGWPSGPQGTSKSYGEVSHPFLEIKYLDKFLEVDFFRSIGRIAVPALQKHWYSDECGNISLCASEVFSNVEQWRRGYWQTFESTITTKLRDWEHEGEYRLILYSLLGGFEDAADRKLVYNLLDLEGIIFGINTSMEHRAQIVRIISEKCKATGRTEFGFEQAYYSPESGRIETYPLKLLGVG